MGRAPADLGLAADLETPQIVDAVRLAETPQIVDAVRLAETPQIFDAVRLAETPQIFDSGFGVHARECAPSARALAAAVRRVSSSGPTVLGVLRDRGGASPRRSRARG